MDDQLEHRQQLQRQQRAWRRVRQVVQFLLLALFVYLFVNMKRDGGSPIPVNIFSLFDPLLAVSSMVAAREWIPAFALALVTVVLTLAVGRVWCGWICPLGTVLELFGPRGRRGLPLKLRQVKYYVLFTILFLALLGSMAFMYFDPITVFIRGLVSFITPAISLAVAVPLVLILLLNLFVERRFWCRYLCPLGGLIGLLSRFAWLKRDVKEREGLQPCRMNCPAGTNVTGFVAQVSQGRFKQASDLIRQHNPLTTVCGHVCPHPCESDCNRKGCDQAISVNSLERFVGDYARERGWTGPKPVPITSDHKVAVVGAGPAGLTAAYHLRRMGYGVKIFETLPVVGGMLTAGIPRYRLPREVLDADVDFITGQGVEIETGVDVDPHKLDELRREYDALFVAVGAHRSRHLGVSGEDLRGVVHGVEFLRELNVSRDVEVGSTVAVIGGGDVAVDAARCALRLGADVTIYYRRSRKEMPCRGEELEEAEEEQVKIEYLVTPAWFLGEAGRVVGMECQRLELGEPDESGRRRPVPIPSSEFTVPVDMVIVAIGQSPELDLLSGSGVEVASRSTIEANAAGETSLAGVFAGGDAVSGPATVTEAIGAGVRAATAIDRYLRGESVSVEERPARRIELEELPREIWPQEGHRPAVATLAAVARRMCFDEVRQTLTPGDAVKEAQRCINWNCAECGICAQVCPMGAIDPTDFSSHPSECTLCMDCVAFCPAGVSVFEGGWGTAPVHEYDPSRRKFLASAATAAAGFGLISTGVIKRTNPHLLRPPGIGGNESEFLSKCVRCGQCLKVCPRQTLRPAAFEAGLDAIWTPVLVPQLGGCDYECNACGQVCPSGAIPPLSLAEKRKAVIGTAFVDRDRCISCMLCEGVCPVHAIGQVLVGDQRYPQVDPDMCIGCGNCEYNCPVEGEVAIRVYARGPYCPSRVLLPLMSEEVEEPEPEETKEPEELEATEGPEATAEPEATEEPEAETEGSDKIAYVDRDLCIRCMLCLKNCPEGAIEEVEVDGVTYPQVVPELCIGCGVCEENCPLPDGPAISLYAPEEYPG